MVEAVDTIFAVSSGLGKSAVAVVRASGPGCTAMLAALAPGRIFADREATLATLRGRDGRPIDRALVIRFCAPRSFTGEDMIEFQTTGSRAVVSNLLNALTEFPRTRAAEPGEFARRAFENGKIDLSEAEGLAAVVESETSAQLQQAQTLASGGLSRECEALRKKLVSAMAEVEATLDFSDVEDSAHFSLATIEAAIGEVKRGLESLLTQSVVAERLRNGMTVVIAGPPNVGKSTMFNCLAKRDIAIVSAIPGTTRDSLEVSLDVKGFPVTLLDTAGMRDTRDPLEAEGIRRAHSLAERADLVLWLTDRELACPSDYSASKVLKVRTKSDVQAYVSDPSTVAICALDGRGIPELISRIAERAEAFFGSAGQPGFYNERQKRAAQDALAALDNIKFADETGLELVAEDLRAAADAIGRIAGRIGVKEVLDEIFLRMCVGK